MRLLLSKIAASELIKNRYFALGVAIQKGIPILLIPVIVSLYGPSVYADYILLYTVVQIVAIITGLCLTQAVIPFWYTYRDKEKFLGSLLALMLIIQSIFSAIAFVVLIQINYLKGHLVNSITVTVIALVYAIIYNMNTFGVNFLRAQSKQLSFLWTTMLGAVLQIILVVLFSKLPGDSFVMFIIANILSVLLQTFTYFLISDNYPVGLFTGKEFLSFSRKMVSFSAPLSAYVLVALLSLVVDKWMVKAFFQQQVFTQYVIDYQFSFSIALTSIVIGMYNTSRQCELVHNEDWIGVRKNTFEHYWLSLLGSFALGIASFFYALFGGVHLSPGFWLLLLGFTVNNVYAVNSSLLTAMKRSNALAQLAVIGTVVFIVLLFAAAYMNLIIAVYAAQVVYQVIILLLSWVGVRTLLTEYATRQTQIR